LPSQTARLEFKTDENPSIAYSSSHRIQSALKPARLTMNNQLPSVPFRSEIVVHNNSGSDVRIKSLSVAFHFHDDSPTDAMFIHRAPSSMHRQSLNIPRKSSLSMHKQQMSSSSNRNLSSTVTTREQSLPPTTLHQWIDDICSHQQLLTNDDIVFFIKNGEFFARI
jgi:hypothetical protein